MEALDLWSNEAAQSGKFQPGEGTQLSATAGESFDSAWNAAKVGIGNLQAAQRTRSQVLDSYQKQIEDLGGDVEAAYSQAWKKAPVLFGTPTPPDRLTVANEVLAGLREKNPSIDLQPMGEDELNHRAAEISRQAAGEAAEVASRETTFGAKAAGVAGSIAGGILTDPFNLLALPLAPEADVRVLGQAAFWGGFGAAQQGVNEAVNQRFIQDVDPGHSAGAAIAEAGAEGAAIGAGGALLGRGIKALGRWWTGVKTPDMPTSLKDAGNVVESEANTLSTNVLPGAEGEAAHRRALSGAIDSILRESPVEPEIGAASRDLMDRLAQERPYEVPEGAGANVARIAEQATLEQRRAAIEAQLPGIEAGNPASAETLARLGQVERELAQAGSYEQRRALSNRRDELLTDTTPERLRAEAAPIEQRRALENERDQIDRRLKELEAERVFAQPQPIVETRGQVPSLYDIHQMRLDQIMKAKGEVEAMSPVGRAQAAPRLAEAIGRYAAGLGHALPDEQLQALAGAVRTLPESEARSVLAELPRRPVTLPETVGEIAKEKRAPSPTEKVTTPSLEASREALNEIAQTPDFGKALQADAERAVDEAAQSGKAQEVPIGIDADGKPIMQSVASLLSEIEADRKAAEELMNCATPMSEAKEVVSREPTQAEANYEAIKAKIAAVPERENLFKDTGIQTGEAIPIETLPERMARLKVEREHAGREVAE